MNQTTPLKTPPSPPQTFLLGHMLDFARNPLEFLNRCAREYNGVLLLRLLNKKFYLIFDPDAVENVFVTNQRNFKKGAFYDPIRPLFGNGLVTSEGDFWLRQRRLIQPAFHRARIQSYAATMVELGEKMLAEEWRDGQVRRIDEDMMQLTLQVVARLLFNLDSSSAEARETGRALGTALTNVGEWSTRPVKLPMFIPTPGNLRVRRAMQLVDESINNLVKQGREAVARHEAPDSLLSMLIEAQDTDGSRMTDQQLRDEIVTLYIAGHETTAMTLTWTWYQLSQHPQAAQKLEAELKAVLNGRTPTFEDLAKLTYTQQIIKETLRLYPIGFMVGRQAIEDCEINGYSVPAGTMLLVSPWATHHDPRLFEQPDEFRPERWEGEAPKKLHKYAYYPFTAGPRQCIGNTFAEVEAVLLLATLAQQYSLSLLPGAKVEAAVSGTVHPKQPLMMRLTKRTPAGATASSVPTAGTPS